MSTQLERAIQILAVIHLGVIGLSHITAARAWAEFFLWLRSKGEAGVFVVGFMSLGFGSLVAAFHPVWSGIPVVLTLLGWAQVVKGLIYFAAPRFGLRRLEMVSLDRAGLFAVPGALFLVIAGLIGYHIVRGA